jgi:UDP-N-acetylglucosamine enolpyruvyl transferase
MQDVRAGGAPVANAVAAARSKIETDYAFDRFLETIKGRMQALGG